jgi:hypothetical protein
MWRQERSSAIWVFPAREAAAGGQPPPQTGNGNDSGPNPNPNPNSNLNLNPNGGEHVKAPRQKRRHLSGATRLKRQRAEAHSESQARSVPPDGGTRVS